MAYIDTAYIACADLNLWFKVRGGDPLKLSDLPQIVPLRWQYFKDNWSFIKNNISNKAKYYDDSDFLNSQIKDFSDFIEKQRNISNKINPFSDGSIFHKYYAIFDNIDVESINLTNDEKEIIDKKTIEVQNYSKNDFLRIKSDLINYRDNIADICGLSDDSYNKIYSKSSAAPQISASAVELNLMSFVQQNISSVDFVLANLFAIDAAVDPFALARINANNPEINIGQYKSGRLVKINYGEDLQSLAYRYLGSTDKWIDIAIANGLKPPYIDEVGEKIMLLSNAKDNQINIAATDINGKLNIDKFYINQIILLQSSVEIFPEQRTIINIRQIPVSNEIILELDGDFDLQKYKTVDGANIRVFKPNTINSSFYILIPSQEPLDNSRQEEVPWFLTKSSIDEKNTGIDLAINESGELTFNTNGDFNLSYGLDNAAQAMRLKIITELGSLRYHPEFGLINIIGAQNLSIEGAKSAIIESLQRQIRNDARFDRLENINITYLVNDKVENKLAAFNVELSVRLAGGSTVIPISFVVAK